MTRWRISKGQAIDLQEWALEESGTREFLDTLPELPKTSKIKPGLYVSYEIDDSQEWWRCVKDAYQRLKKTEGK